MYPSDKCVQFVLVEWVTWVPWISTQRNSTYTLCFTLVFTSNRRGKTCVTGLTVTAEKSIRDNKECNITVTKYLSLVFSPALSLGSVYLSAPLMRFHENSETEQVGVVAPGVGTTRLNREEAMLKDFCYLSLSNPSTASNSIQGINCGIAHVHVLTDKSAWCKSVAFNYHILL